MAYTDYNCKKSPRIATLIDNMLSATPQIEADRGVLLTESYRATEGEPIITRRAKAFAHILKNIPITIRPLELVVGSSTVRSRSCQVFPEFSYEWLEEEFETVATREADPFYISDDTKAKLREAYKYWKGKTTSELATSYMTDEALLAIEHNIFTVGNYFYNGIGHVSVDYGKILKIGYKGIIEEAKAQLAKFNPWDPEFPKKSHFLNAVITTSEAAITYAERYAEQALKEANACSDPARKAELLQIAENCKNVPANGAKSFWEACQSFWFIQQLIQIESSGHSISPGRFDQYMYPYFKKDLDAGKITPEFAQELIDCIWVKINDLNKCRDSASAKGFAGYSMFQNLIAGGQTREGEDATNDISFMCLQASLHTLLPAPSLSIRVWNKSPHEFMLKAAEVTKTGIGLPAYYNDEVIIPALINRGLTMEDARNYCIIGCVEPQTPGKTDGWHDAAFFNMCRPLELVFSSGRDNGVQIGPNTGDVTKFTSFEQFVDAYQVQMNYFINLMVNADNAIDYAHAERCPLPFLSSMVDDCISRGKSAQEGGAHYNFTGPQGFGVANVADAMYAIRELVFNQKKYTLAEIKEALQSNFGNGADVQKIVAIVVEKLKESGIEPDAKDIETICRTVASGINVGDSSKYAKIREDILELEKFGNDNADVDALAREMAYTYTRPLENYKNPRDGVYQAGLYPVSANVPLGAQTGATPDGRLAYTPVADGVSPTAGADKNGPTAAANSVSKLDHFIASNGTLYNMKFHPSALAGKQGLNSFVALIRSYFDQKGSHMQFNVVSRETLLDAQKHPENYKSLVVRVAGYSALFTTLSRSLQDDIINRTEQSGF